MALRCEQCQRGRDIGHNVSHAKNRTVRHFKPNLQKLMVLKNGVRLNVKFCTSCIQRLKKYGHVGMFYKFSFASVQVAPVSTVSERSHKNIDREEKKIEEIMKKEEKRLEDKAKKAKVQKEEAKKIEELVGKK